jgi:hypothetical protein
VGGGGAAPLSFKEQKQRLWQIYILWGPTFSLWGKPARDTDRPRQDAAMRGTFRPTRREEEKDKRHGRALPKLNPMA